MGNINNVVAISTSIDGKFFRYWLEFTKPIHKLSEREIDVVSAFLKYRYELEKKIQDKDLLDDIVLNKESRIKIRQECNMTYRHFQVIMTKLKRLSIIENGRINPRFIPKLSLDADNFNLLISFSIKK